MVYEFERDSLLFKLPFKQIVEVWYWNKVFLFLLLLSSFLYDLNFNSNWIVDYEYIPVYILYRFHWMDLDSKYPCGNPSKRWFFERKKSSLYDFNVEHVQWPKYFSSSLTRNRMED